MGEEESVLPPEPEAVPPPAEEVESVKKIVGIVDPQVVEEL